MQKIFATFLFIVFSFVFSFAQTSNPTPKPAENDDEVVKISTNLIQIDVTVTDKKGKIVTNLKPEDFEVFENNEKQTITNFSYVNSSHEAQPKPILQPNKNEAVAPIPVVQLKPEQINRTIALVVDDLGLSFESTYYVQRALKKFVNEQMQPNDLVAIIRTGSGVGALQQFTFDKNQLFAAIEKIRYRFGNRTENSPFTPMGRNEIGKIQRTDGGADRDKKLDNEINEFRDSRFTGGTLGAINYVIRGMQELPGKKSVMLLSDGLIFCAPEIPGHCLKMEKIFRELTELANRATVTIYTQDSRGLQTIGINASDRVENITAAQEVLKNRSTYLYKSQEGLAYLAKETGGKALLNNNDLNAGLGILLEDTKGYYLLGYQPDTDTFDAKTRKFNKLIVKVKNNDLTVRYRSGFFGVVDSDTRRLPTTNLTPAQQIHRAISSPFAENGINLKLNTLFGKDAKNGSFMRSFLHIEGKDLKFVDGENGSKQAIFNLLAVSFGDNGVAIDQIANTYTLTANQQLYEKIVKDGFVYNFVFPIKEPGAYQMRVAIRDTNSLLVGSANQFIEVPDLKKGRPTLSGILLENFTEAQWKELQQGKPAESKELRTDPMLDTSLRRFKKGTALRYALEIYNAKLDQTKKPNLSTQIRMFRDGKIAFEGKPTPYNLEGQSDFGSINLMGALVLGGAIQAGDYVLQIIVIDNLQKDKSKLSTQWVQFEVVD